MIKTGSISKYTLFYTCSHFSEPKYGYVVISIFTYLLYLNVLLHNWISKIYSGPVFIRRAYASLLISVNILHILNFFLCMGPCVFIFSNKFLKIWVYEIPSIHWDVILSVSCCKYISFITISIKLFNQGWYNYDWFDSKLL